MTWTRFEIRAARQTPLRPVLEALGYRGEPVRDGNCRIDGLPGEVIVKDHYWVRTDDGAAGPVPAREAMSGNAIDFFVKLRGKSFREAMRLLSDTAAQVELLAS